MAVQKTFRFISDWGITDSWQVDDRDTSSVTAAINPGEPLKIASTADFVIPFVDGDGEIATDTFVGLARKKSTETASAEGAVEYIAPIPGKTILRGLATTATNVDTTSELDALRGNYVAVDVTALAGTNGDFTIDEDETSDPNGNMLLILRGNTLKGTLDCLIHVLATMAGNQGGQTID
jgi:hypothetical protein